MVLANSGMAAVTWESVRTVLHSGMLLLDDCCDCCGVVELDEDCEDESLERPTSVT